MYNKLFPTLDSDTLILTANSRLSRHLLARYEHYQQNQKKIAWATPSLQPITAWLSMQWQHNPSASGRLLSETEESLLWQTVLMSDQTSSVLLQLRNTAIDVKQAWNTMNSWQIPLSELEQTNEEISKFCLWSKKFEEIKAAKALVCQSELPKAITRLIKENKITLPKKIFLVGFDDLSPALKNLIENLKNTTNVETFEEEKYQSSIKKIGLADVEKEITCMAKWAQEKLVTLKPGEKIGCIIPRLNTLRTKAKRIFTEQFEGAGLAVYQKKTQAIFNISSGESLNQVEIIKVALSVLKLKYCADKDHTSSVLLSPYINSTSDDQLLGAMLESTLDHKELKKRQFRNLLINASQLQEDFYPNSNLSGRLQALVSEPIASGTHTFSFWAVLISKLLKAIGWPGNRVLNSFEYQAMDQWLVILEEITALDQLFPPISFNKAVDILIQLCSACVFQPQTQDTPIQVLGLLEASGCQFDSLWLMGLNENDWPPSPSPNPFLPLELQRRLNMPHASARREHQYCVKIQEKLLASANDVITSYALSEEDRTLHPSPLISAIEKTDYTKLNLKDFNQTQQCEEVEMLTDKKGPKLNEQELIHGGSTILQSQALCAFRAFAKHRLQAEPLDENEIGMNAADRGSGVHQVLDQLWQTIEDHNNLISLTTKDLQQLIAQAIESTRSSHTCSESLYWKVERERLKRLIKDWLEVEKKRPPFFVESRETKKNIQIGPLSINIQIDRVDKLENNDRLIIDYKTGLNNSISSWFGERPLQPQLPIYFLSSTEKTCGLAYAEVNLSSLQFKGIIEEQTCFSKITTLEKVKKECTNIDDQKEKWQKDLTQLSEKFYQGEAEVDPINAQACQYCSLISFCRLGEEQ